jgi:hypothetical protein
MTLKVVPVRKVFADLPHSVFDLARNNPDILNKGLSTFMISEYSSLFNKGNLMAKREFEKLKSDNPALASLLINEIVNQSGSLVLATYIFTKTRNKDGILNYISGDVNYHVELPKIMSDSLNSNPVALDFCKSPCNITFTRENKNTIHVKVSISKKRKIASTACVQRTPLMAFSGLPR